MIARLRGVLVARTQGSIVLDVHGVGYQVAVPLSTFSKLPPAGQEVTLLTHLAVRESSLDLYGFATASEKEIF